MLEKIDCFMESVKEKEACSIREIRTISMKNVCFKYPSQKENTLEIEDLQIHCGKKYLIAGKSGCGKSTLLNLVCHLAEPEQGQILFQGEPLSKDSVCSIGYMLQKDHLFDWRSIEKQYISGTGNPNN